MPYSWIMSQTAYYYYWMHQLRFKLGPPSQVRTLRTCSGGVGGVRSLTKWQSVPIRDPVCFFVVLQVRPLPGHLLLFPSWLEHRVAPTPVRDNRVTIAFNIGESWGPVQETDVVL